MTETLHEFFVGIFFLKILTVDRDHPPNCIHLSKLRPLMGNLGQPLLPPCRASCPFPPDGP